MRLYSPLQDTSVIPAFYLRGQAIRILGRKSRDLSASKPANPNRTEYKIAPGCPELAVLLLSRPLALGMSLSSSGTVTVQIGQCCPPDPVLALSTVMSMSSNAAATTTNLGNLLP